MKSNYEYSTSGLRITAALISLTISVMFLLAMSYLFRSPDSIMGEVLFDRQTTSFPYPFTIQNSMWVMFFIGCGELIVRFRESALQMAEVYKGYLPEDDSTMLRAEDLGHIYKNVRAVEGKRVFFLQRLIGRCILQFQSSRKVDQANSLLNSSLELFQHELDMHYSMLRYLVWFIPTLGFIGTVVGIAFALNYAAGMDPQDPTLLAGISKQLGVAFYTTLLALVQSAFLVFGLHVAQDRDELSLNRSGQYALDNLINRLYEK